LAVLFIYTHFLFKGLLSVFVFSYIAKVKEHHSLPLSVMGILPFTHLSQPPNFHIPRLKTCMLRYFPPW
jgi:hypothetical protein